MARDKVALGRAAIERHGCGCRRRRQLAAALDRSAEQPLQQLVSVYSQMGCDVPKNRGERADLEGAMRRNRYVVYGGRISRQSKMTLALAHDAVADAAECFRKLVAAQIPRQFHAAMTSSPYATIADDLRRSNLVFSPDAVGGGYMELELEVLSWSPGNALARSLTAGISNSGEATLSVEATLIEVSQGGVKSKPVAQSVFTTASRGNLLYTGTAQDPWSRAAGEIAKWLGDQL